jgi:CDP-diacylglycerol--serine O-phosphatidyltransferase
MTEFQRESDKERPFPRHKSVYILPNLFTTASLLSGFVGMLWAADGGFEACALAILFSALMDGLDGKVARLTNTASEFGVQYDSLADLVAFGATPAFMMFQFTLHQYNKLGIAVGFLFTVCSALRLARFNVTTSAASKRFFTGLPTPAAGCTLACIILFAPSLPEFMQSAVGGLSLILTAAIAFLMVSNIRYAAFKELGAFKVHPFRNMVFAIAIFALIVANPRVFGTLVLFAYIISGLVYTFILLPRMARAVNRAAMHAAQHAQAQAHSGGDGRQADSASTGE